ncbi:MAG: hypothetical protein VX000_00935, partial [Myxococcota bacterium]|nr:hypothetical protein [Myxococcota bacterium]
DGLFDHPAGLSPSAASQLLSLLPPGPVLDPFIGGGAVALAARRAGRPVIGRDVSEAALCVTRARCWLPDPTEAMAYRQNARATEDPAFAGAVCGPPQLPEPMRSAVEATRAAAPTPRARDRLIDAAIRAWRDERGRVPPGTPAPDLARADARFLTLAQPVPGILTSPPYPGVYDYDRWTSRLRHARGQHGDIEQEIGARRGFRAGLAAASLQWRAATMAWTAAAARALCPGGRMVIVIGDGPRPDGPIDTRAASISAAEQAGLRLLEAATAQPGSRPSPRREHALLFERPNVY